MSVYGTSHLLQTVWQRKKARIATDAGLVQETPDFVLFLFRNRLNGSFGVNETEAVERAVAIADEVVELTAERPATFKGAEEPGSAGHKLSRWNQHTVTEQVRRVAARGTRDRTRAIGLIAIRPEGDQVAATECAGEERQIQLLPLPCQTRRICRRREDAGDIPRRESDGATDLERLGLPSAARRTRSP